MSQVTTTTTYVAPVAPPYGVATSQAPPTYQMQGAFVQPNSESSPLLLTETQSVTFGEVPVRCVCTFCRKEMISEVSYEPGLLTWLACGGLALFGCVLGCCLIPFCVDAAKDVVHTCPHCHNVIGKRVRVK